MDFSSICRINASPGHPFPHHLRIATLLAVMVCGMLLQGCAPATLSHVLIGNRLAGPGEYDQVQVFQKDMRVQTQQGMDLKRDNVIETDDHSWAVITFKQNGPKVIMKPGTRGRISSFDIEFGEIVVIIEKKLSGLFKVKTEDVVAGPESTIFSVSKITTGPSTVSVIRGTVRLSSPNQAWSCVTIKQNQRASSVHGKRPTTSALPHETFNEIIGWANRVELAISPAQAHVIVPNLDSMPREEARRRIEAAGLRIGEVIPKVTPARPPLGTVVEQTPAPGTYVRKGTAVHIGVEVEPVRLPQLIHKPFQHAQALLVQSGLKLGRVDRRITGSAPAETVIEQHPGGGLEVPTGSTVDLVVEEESVLVPDLRGLDRTAAQSTLDRARLFVDRWDEEITGSQPPHTVLRQSPGPNERVRPGTRVRLVLEAESVLVPHLIGQHRDRVGMILNQHRLIQGSMNEQITGKYPVDTVIRQDPPPGQRVRLETPIHLTVEAASVVVPNIVGLVMNVAGNTLANNSLRLGRVTEELRENVNDDVILRQSPQPGQRVPPQTAIEIVRAVNGRRVPNLGGQTQRGAQAILNQYGLSWGGASTRPSDARASWNRVIDQSPRTGTLVRRGTPVSIVTGTMPPCRVPNVVGMSAANADKAIQSARLVPYNRKNAAGIALVRSQSPAAGTILTCGGGVSYDAEIFMPKPFPVVIPGTIQTAPPTNTIK